jgi:C4-type Zn-finger protein
MSRYFQQQEEVHCPSCEVLNLVTYRYSDFSPASQEQETGRCDKCGAPIGEVLELLEKWVGVHPRRMANP